MGDPFQQSDPKLLKDLPQGFQEHVIEKMAGAYKLLNKNDLAIRGVVTELIAQAEQAGKDAAVQALETHLQEYETLISTTQNNNQSWYDQVDSASRSAVVQQQTIGKIIATQLEHDISSPIYLVPIQSDIINNKGAIDQSILETKYPELPDINELLDPEKRQTIQTALEARVVSGIYDSFKTHEPLENALNRIEALRGEYASLPAEDPYASSPDPLTGSVEALKDVNDDLFAKYAELKDKAYEIEQGSITHPNQLKEVNNALSDLLTEQEKMMQNITALIKANPQLSLDQELKNTIHEYVNVLSGKKENVEINKQYITTLSLGTRASLEQETNFAQNTPSPPSSMGGMG